MAFAFRARPKCDSAFERETEGSCSKRYSKVCTAQHLTQFHKCMALAANNLALLPRPHHPRPARSDTPRKLSGNG